VRRRGTAGALVAAAACLLAACSLKTGSGRRGESAPEVLRIWMEPIVRWEPGAARVVDVALENATDRTLAIAEPDAAHVRVAVFARPEGTAVCGVEPREGAAGRGRVELAPGDRVAVRVDLAEACADLPPGDYRYEVSYRAPALPAGEGEGAGPAPRPYSGNVATRYGEVVVEASPWPDRRTPRPPPRAARRPPRVP
jgi:hypothetical protein